MQDETQTAPMGEEQKVDGAPIAPETTEEKKPEEGIENTETPSEATV